MKRSGSIIIVFLGLWTGCVWAQQGGSITDGITPSLVGAGSPAGSYALGELDTVSLYSGNLNVTIPLLKIGGRGEAGYTMVVPIQRRWRIETTFSNGSSIYAALTNDTPVSHWWSDNAPAAYSPGHTGGQILNGGSDDVPGRDGVGVIDTDTPHLHWGGWF